jgi:hypothetical protein
LARGGDAVRLRIGRDQWTVAQVPGEEQLCSTCGCTLIVAFSCRKSSFCARCLYARLSSNQVDVSRAPRKAGDGTGPRDLVRPPGNRRRPTPF